MSATDPEAGQDLRAAFQELTGQELTDAGEAHLRRFADHAGIKSNDALWLILFGFESYRSLYADIPKQVADAAGLIVRNEAEALTAHGERVRDAMKAALADKSSELAAMAVATLVKELKTGAARKVIEEQAREALAAPVRDAAAKLERLGLAAQAATDRYEKTQSSWWVWVVALGAGLFGGLAAGTVPTLLAMFLR